MSWLWKRKEPLPVEPVVPPVVRIGRYEIIARVGAGGMAEAFRATARGPGGYRRELIIKSILPKLSSDPDFVSLFIAEAKLLGMINHPNVVQVYDFGEEDGRHFLALEYLDGPCLEQILLFLSRTDQMMSVALVAHIAREMCLGLSAAHRLCGPDGQPLYVVHRDATPSNVLTTTAGAVKLVDFGIARLGLRPKGTHSGSVQGKPAYLAPEQIRGGAVDERADLFTAGVVLYEMLTHLSPFLGADPLTCLHQVVEKMVPPPSRLRHDIPPLLDAVVMRALQKSPADRYQTAAEMADDLATISRQDGDGREHVARVVAQWNQSRKSTLALAVGHDTSVD
jgi:eukaryotic-like serine/threonine-protein kinase